MPNPIQSCTFEPDADGTIICTSTFSVQQTGTAGDWNHAFPGTVMQVRRVSDNALLQAGPFQPASSTRAATTYRASFPVLMSDGAVSVVLNGQGGGPGTGIEYWDVTMTVELIKR